MPNIQSYAAPSVYDPPMYSQAVKVSGAETILFIAGQVAYGPEGAPILLALTQEHGSGAGQ